MLALTKGTKISFQIWGGGGKLADKFLVIEEGYATLSLCCVLYHLVKLNTFNIITQTLLSYT